MKIVDRNGTFYLVRRVPKRYGAVEPRAKINHSLSTDSPQVARRKAETYWSGLVETWEARLAGDTSDAEARYEAARSLAQSKGLRFLRMAEVADLPIDQLVPRILATADKAGKPSLPDARAVLGTVEKPEITVTRALDLFWKIAADRALGKSEDQLRRWRNPRIKAVRNFVAVAGDLPLQEITPDDMQDFRDWWLERIKAGEVLASSANKDMTHLADTIRTVVKARRLGLDVPLGGWSFKVGEKRTRPAFSTEWITNKLLRPGALDGLNADARDLFIALINTGARPSELLVLGKDQIRLDVPIPHISIEPIGRTLKTPDARRAIPLLGVSLEAMRRHPDGFTRYRESAGATQLINNYLANNGLKETPEHTTYSLRHAFQDRMLAAGIDDRIRRDLFGHALTEERYGAGASLEMKAKVLLPVAL